MLVDMQGINYVRRISLFAVPIIISALYLIWSYEADRDILHDNNTVVIPYNDHQSTGNSVCGYTRGSDGSITYTYTLGNSIWYPYAGIMILNKDSSLFDLSAYNTLTVNAIDNLGKGIIPVLLFTEIPGYSYWGKVESFFNLQSLIPTEAIGTDYDLPFETFSAPKWWYEIQTEDMQSRALPAYDRIALFNFANLGSSRIGVEHSVTITSIKARKRIAPQVAMALLFVGICYAAAYAYRFFNRSPLVPVTVNPVNKHVTFTYEKIDVQNESDQDALVFEYINNHYFMPELSIADVQQHTGLSERKISHIIKEETDLGFKQYVNSIRLSEAKRLLKESDLQVSEIAYRIGYNNVTHFNRVFKLAEGISPSNYRDQFNS